VCYTLKNDLHEVSVTFVPCPEHEKTWERSDCSLYRVRDPVKQSLTQLETETVVFILDVSCLNTSSDFYG
jgi:hypothetical protein